MELSKAIQKRHSVRSFEKKKVPRSVLKSLIKSAIKAPSASNRQPWIFYVVETAAKRDEIAQVLSDTLNVFKKDIEKKPKKIQTVMCEFYSNLGEAQNLIFAFRKKNKNESPHIYPNDIASISCAFENVMLSAVEKGFGTCWVGSFKDPKAEAKLKNILSIPKDEDLVASLVIGYPAKDFKPLKRRKKKMSEVLKFV